MVFGGKSRAVFWDGGDTPVGDEQMHDVSRALARSVWVCVCRGAGCSLGRGCLCQVFGVLWILHVLVAAVLCCGRGESGWWFCLCNARWFCSAARLAAFIIEPGLVWARWELG